MLLEAIHSFQEFIGSEGANSYTSRLLLTISIYAFTLKPFFRLWKPRELPYWVPGEYSQNDFLLFSLIMYICYLSQVDVNYKPV